jgi:MoaA/NifB/PqqE/SkfB family radical SAM enzyme
MRTGLDGYAQADDSGRLVLSPDIAARYDIKPGVRVRVDERANSLHVRRPVSQLAKLYVEPTNLCNLDCRTCIRNVWDEPLGLMSDAVFSRVLEGLRAFSSSPAVFFGGFGEPLFHCKIAEMVAEAKSLRTWVELITNGTRLTKALSKELIAAGLDVLWVSIDGATPESYADVRLGAALPQVLENIKHFRDMRKPAHRPAPEIGIVFVAMKRNIADLPAVLRLGRGVGASRFLVTNVLPYTDALRHEVLYHRALGDVFHLPSIWGPHLTLPKIDVNDTTREPLYQVLRSGANVIWAGDHLGTVNDRCPFVASGAGAVGWNGIVSPCLPLLHSHTSFLDDRERFARGYSLGNVLERDLGDLWSTPEHLAFRERVQDFEFSPCTSCGGCHFSQANEEDCFGNNFPTCGGCLWAQGVIQCP